METKKRLAVLLFIAAVAATGLGYLLSRVDFLPNPSSPERQSIDSLLKILIVIAGVFLVIILVFFTDTLLFFRQRRGDLTDGPPMRGKPALEVVWTLVPLIIVILLGAYGGIVLDRMTAPPPPRSELEVDVLAFRFGWQFTYPEYGVESFELGLPVDRPVLVRLTARDVVHAFWVPEFGPKQDAVPGMTTELRFTPTKLGSYQVYCSQLCGFGHSYMIAPVAVTSPSDFQAWLKKQTPATAK